MKFVSKFEHRCRHFEPYSAARRRFHDAIPSERWLPKRLINYYSGLWLLLSQTCSQPRNDSTEDSEVESPLEKNWILLTLWRMPRQLDVFLMATNFESDRMTSHKHSLAAKTVSKWRPLKSIFQDQFLQDSEHLRGGNRLCSVEVFHRISTRF